MYLAAHGEKRNRSVDTYAELARRLANELSEPNAVKALLEIAAALDEDADKLERDVVTKLLLSVS